MSYIQVCSAGLSFSAYSQTQSHQQLLSNLTQHRLHQSNLVPFMQSIVFYPSTQHIFIPHSKKQSKKLCKKKIQTKHRPIFCWVRRWLQMGCYSFLSTEHIWLRSKSNRVANTQPDSCVRQSRAFGKSLVTLRFQRSVSARLALVHSNHFNRILVFSHRVAPTVLCPLWGMVKSQSELGFKLSRF